MNINFKTSNLTIEMQPQYKWISKEFDTKKPLLSLL